MQLAAGFSSGLLACMDWTARHDTPVRRTGGRSGLRIHALERLVFHDLHVLPTVTQQTRATVCLGARCTFSVYRKKSCVCGGSLQKCLYDIR